MMLVITRDATEHDVRFTISGEVWLIRMVESELFALRQEWYKDHLGAERSLGLGFARNSHGDLIAMKWWRLAR